MEALPFIFGLASSCWPTHGATDIQRRPDNPGTKTVYVLNATNQRAKLAGHNRHRQATRQGHDDAPISSRRFDHDDKKTERVTPVKFLTVVDCWCTCPRTLLISGANGQDSVSSWRSAALQMT